MFYLDLFLALWPQYTLVPTRTAYQHIFFLRQMSCALFFAIVHIEPENFLRYFYSEAEFARILADKAKLIGELLPQKCCTERSTSPPRGRNPAGRRTVSMGPIGSTGLKPLILPTQGQVPLGIGRGQPAAGGSHLAN